MFEHEVEVTYTIRIRAKVVSYVDNVNDIEEELDTMIQQQSGIADIEANSVELSDIETIDTICLDNSDYQDFYGT